MIPSMTPMAFAAKTRQGNRSRSVEDPAIRRRIAEIVDELVQ
jgi:hypothetical protein